MGALVAAVAVHAVRVDHEVEFLSCLLHGIQKLEGILVMDIVITGAVCQLQHYRFYGTLLGLCVRAESALCIR